MKKFSLLLVLALIASIFITGCNTKTENTESNNTTNQEETQDNTEINTTSWSQTDNIQIENIQTDKNTDKSRIYENKTNNFSFEFPDGREFQEDKYGFTVVVFTPKDDEVKENIWVAIQKLQKFISIQEYYEETVNKLQETLNEFNEVSHYETTNKNTDWLKWKTIIYEYQEWELTLKSQQTFLISTENTVYILNYTATKDTFNNFIDWVEQIVNTFSLN